ncbi:MAG: Hpt domain-containing protein [Rhodospirillales bacterium]|nr:Hpt domain-containing protein [Rhodospirillales bacterium]
MADDKLEIINPPNALKQKVGTGGPGAVDLEALERAEKVISGMTDSYLEWVAEDLIKIEKAYTLLVASNGDGKEEMKGIFQIAHDIKGQGGSFGYGLMTAIGNELCRLIEKTDVPGPGETEAIKLHIDALKLVIGGDLKGNGGKAGEKMLSGLQQICDKLVV